MTKLNTTIETALKQNKKVMIRNIYNGRYKLLYPTQNKKGEYKCSNIEHNQKDAELNIKKQRKFSHLLDCYNEFWGIVYIKHLN